MTREVLCCCLSVCVLLQLVSVIIGLLVDLLVGLVVGFVCCCYVITLLWSEASTRHCGWRLGLLKQHNLHFAVFPPT